MKRFLNAGFGSELSLADLDLIKSLGYDGIRQNVPNEEDAYALVENAVSNKMSAIFILPVANNDLCQNIAHAIAERCVAMGIDDAIIEVGNEEDLRGKRWSNDPHGWALLVADVMAIAKQHQFLGSVISGGVSSLSRSAMDWLQISGIAKLGCGIGYHQYRSSPPAKPLDGYSSRDDEFRTLTGVAAGNSIFCTEGGWSSIQKHGSYTDAEISTFLHDEVILNEAHGAKCFTVYQLNDGPDPNDSEDHFGIRRIDGSLKLQAGIFRLMGNG